MASGLSARLRKALAPVIGIRTDRKLMYRLNDAFRAWLRRTITENTMPPDNIPSLEGFCFYGKPVNSYFTGLVLAERKADGFSLDISPLVQDTMPANDKPVAITVTGISCDLENKAETKVYETRVSMDAGVEQKIDLALDRREGCISVLVMSVNKLAVGILAASLD